MSSGLWTLMCFNICSVISSKSMLCYVYMQIRVPHVLLLCSMCFSFGGRCRSDTALCSALLNPLVISCVDVYNYALLLSSVLFSRIEIKLANGFVAELIDLLNNVCY